MNQNRINIAIDAMGGDDSPFKSLKGAEIFYSKYKDVNIIFLECIVLYIISSF